MISTVIQTNKRSRGRPLPGPQNTQSVARPSELVEGARPGVTQILHMTKVQQRTKHGHTMHASMVHPQRAGRAHHVVKKAQWACAHVMVWNIVMRDA